MLYRFFTWRKSDDGVAAVEFALLVPLIVALLVGIIDFGMYAHTHMRLEDLSRAAVQYVVLGGSPDEMPGSVIESSEVYQQSVDAGYPLAYTAEQICECGNGDIVSCESPDCGSGDYVRAFYHVEVRGSFSPILTYPGMSSPMTLTGDSRMQYNW